jgi:DNA-binding transcriptional LysR family regulator
MQLDWEKLRLFHAVAEAGSFTEAAKRLHMSQPALSRQIQALEASLGAKLFHRHARGLAMTHEGEQLHEATAEMHDRIERTQQGIEFSRERPTGEIRLTTTVSFGSTWLVRQLRDFLDLYPDINVDLILSDDDLDLSKREADVAIRFHEPHHSDHIQKALAPVRYWLCASPEYLAKHGEPKNAEELDRHRVVAYGPLAPNPIRGVNWILDVAHSGPPRVPALTVNNIFGLLQAVEAGIGIAALPSYLIHFSGKVRPILTTTRGPVFRTFFVYPPELKRSVRVAVLRDFIVKRMTPELLDGARFAHAAAA